MENIDCNDRYERSSEDVRSMIGFAKLDETKLTHITQVLHYAPKGENYENYKLLQLNSALVTELKEGQTFVFKGGRSEDAVLCTDNKTYEIKEAETSNSMLLVPRLLWPKESNLDESLNTSQDDDCSLVESIDVTISSQNEQPRPVQHKKVLRVFYTYYELQNIKPKFRKLDHLLQLTRFSGPEHEYAIDKSLLFTYDQLLNTIQASREELQQGLADIKAIEIDGYFRILHFEYEFRVLSYMLELIEENSWKPNEIERDLTIESLRAVVPEIILMNTFDIYTIEVGMNKYKYKEDLVSRLFAQTILKNATKFNLNDFLSAWKQSMPEGMVANESYLSGVALIDRDSSPPCIRALDQSLLPASLHDRFRELFKIKPMWSLPQIAPYIECFTTPKLAVSALLAKNARASTVNGVRYYGAKHAS